MFPIFQYITLHFVLTYLHALHHANEHFPLFMLSDGYENTRCCNLFVSINDCSDVGGMQAGYYLY